MPRLRGGLPLLLHPLHFGDEGPYGVDPGQVRGAKRLRTDYQQHFLLYSNSSRSHVGGGYVSESFKEIMGILHETQQVNPLLELTEGDGCPVKDVRTSSGKTFAEEMDLRTFDISAMSDGPMLSESLKEGTKKSHKEVRVGAIGLAARLSTQF